jgi:hypothetical protein
MHSSTIMNNKKEIADYLDIHYTTVNKIIKEAKGGN